MNEDEGKLLSKNYH